MVGVKGILLHVIHLRMVVGKIHELSMKVVGVLLLGLNKKVGTINLMMSLWLNLMVNLTGTFLFKEVVIIRIVHVTIMLASSVINQGILEEIVLIKAATEVVLQGIRAASTVVRKVTFQLTVLSRERREAAIEGKEVAATKSALDAIRLDTCQETAQINKVMTEVVVLSVNVETMEIH